MDWNDADDETKLRHCLEVLRSFKGAQDIPTKRALLALQDFLGALATPRVDPANPVPYTKAEVLALHTLDLEGRDEENVLEFRRRVDPMWENYNWDDELELYVPN